MLSAGSRPSSRLLLVIGMLGATGFLLSWHGSAWASHDGTVHPIDSKEEERVELFLGLLKRRAKRILEARRPPPPPFLSVSTSLAEGYESNVNLDGDKRGDFYTEETLGVALRPKVTDWLKPEFTYDLLSSHYTDLRDANLWTNTLGATFKIQPHKRVRVDVGYTYSIIDFPFDTNSSFFDKRTSVFLLLAQTGWLTHKTGWIYQLRDYDTRRARDPDGNGIPDVVREDQRHVVSHELRFRFPKTAVRVRGQFYRNFSNELRRDFYDWEDYQVRGILTRVLSPTWVALLVSNYERKNYQKRRVPTINVAERDNLLTLSGSFIHQLAEETDLTYSLTYRHQDSNDPRLDFIDWVNQLRLTVSF